MPQRRTLCVAVMLCALGLADIGPLTREVAGLDAARTEPTTGKAVAEPARRIPERFMVRYQGVALLGPDGEEKSGWSRSLTGRGRSRRTDAGRPSPVQAEPAAGPEAWPARDPVASNPEDRMSVPLVWGTTGSSFLPLWSSDSRRILICEQGFNEDRSRRSAYRVYDLATKGLTTLQLPEQWWPSDRSADGKHLLTSLRTANGSLRVAWVRIDGTGEPEFVTRIKKWPTGPSCRPITDGCSAWSDPGCPRTRRTGSDCT